MTEPFPEDPEYLEDPEVELGTWEEYIFADDEAEARRECIRIGKEANVRLMGVKRYSRRSKQWICQFRSYEEEAQ
ncbi:MAG: hypothetical protein AAGA60_03065 [Cyanobacteria bacterium P01_E01_bin.42]